MTCVAEIPSGFLSDKFGALKMTFWSVLFRGSGLLLLAIFDKHLVVLILSAILTALGDSLYSGTLTSWIVERTKNSELDQGKLFSHNYMLVSLVSFVGGYLEADQLGNIELRLPLISGAVILYVVGLVSLSLVRFDTAPKPPEPLRFTFERQIWQKKRPLLETLILFLPLTFITAGPYNQWQLYFQRGPEIKTGLILVGINLAGMLGAFAFNWSAKLSWKTEQLFLAHVVALCLSVWLLIYSSYYLALAFMWLHVALCASTEVLQTKLLHEKITDDLRTTWVSGNNTLEALVTTVALALNGFLADHFGLALAWGVGALLGLLATVGWAFWQRWNH
ncbi:MFS transporter [Ligilactobacillus animalis]|uniref:MFS transporter n=1 Tax=Ligilactobacillus animalis TaxID=1605 RepID=UPI002942C05B|nr:MFS transporter [Ligilactobacillus animalis]